MLALNRQIEFRSLHYFANDNFVVHSQH